MSYYYIIVFMYNDIIISKKIVLGYIEKFRLMLYLIRIVLQLICVVLYLMR